MHRAQEEPVLCPWAVVVFVVVVVVFIHEIVLVRAGATSLFLINEYTLHRAQEEPVRELLVVGC